MYVYKEREREQQQLVGLMKNEENKLRNVENRTTAE
jgi:hypothetical protein